MPLRSVRSKLEDKRQQALEDYHAAVAMANAAKKDLAELNDRLTEASLKRTADEIKANDTMRKKEAAILQREKDVSELKAKIERLKADVTAYTNSKIDLKEQVGLLEDAVKRVRGELHVHERLMGDAAEKEAKTREEMKLLDHGLGSLKALNEHYVALSDRVEILKALKKQLVEEIHERTVEIRQREIAQDTFMHDLKVYARRLQEFYTEHGLGELRLPFNYDKEPVPPHRRKRSEIEADAL